MFFLSMSVMCSRFIIHNVDGCVCDLNVKTEDQIILAAIYMIDSNWYLINVRLVRSLDLGNTVLFFMLRGGLRVYL